MNYLHTYHRNNRTKFQDKKWNKYSQLYLKKVHQIAMILNHWKNNNSLISIKKLSDHQIYKINYYSYSTTLIKISNWYNLYILEKDIYHLMMLLKCFKPLGKKSLLIKSKIASNMLKYLKIKWVSKISNNTSITFDNTI